MKKIVRRIMSCLLAAVMLLGLLPAITPTAEAASYAAVVCDNNGNTLIWYTSHQAAWAEAVCSGHTLKLLSNWYANDDGEMDEGAKGDDKDYFSNDTLYVPKGKSVTIDLNGYDINRRLSEDERDGEVIYLSRDASLTIRDTSSSGSGAIRGGYSKNGAGGIHAKADSCIYLESGTISGCRSTEEGGAVYLDSGARMNMSGGTIYLCSADKGGAVYAYGDSWFTMSGGAIVNNTSKDEDGTETKQENAVVYLYNAAGIFYGGQIVHNNGNGIFSDWSVLRLSGSVDISDNSGYGVVLYEESTQVTMTGGTITKNQMGGVLVGIESEIKMGGSIQIYNNRNGQRNMYLDVYVDQSGWNINDILCSTISILDGGFEPSAKIGLSTSDSRFIHTNTGAGGDKDGIFYYGDKAYQYCRFFFGDNSGEPRINDFVVCGENGNLHLGYDDGQYAHEPNITGVASIVDGSGQDITSQCSVSIDRNAFAVNIGVPENVDVTGLTITYELDDFSATRTVWEGNEQVQVDMLPTQHGKEANYTNPQVLTYFRAGQSGGRFFNDCWQNWTVTVTKTQGVNIYNVTVDGGTGGGSYRAGQSVTVQADEKAGKRFLAWRAEGVELTEEQRATSPMTFTMPNNAVTLKALYEPVQSQVDLTITAPVGGQALDDTATVTTPDGEAELPVQWTPTAPAAGFGKEYTAVVTISTGSYSFSQDVTATVNGSAAQVTRVDDYTIAVSYTFKTAKAKLLSITPVTLSGVANGTSLADIVKQLGNTVGIQSEDASITTARVTWDTDSARYNPAAQFEQIVAVKGTVTLPDNMEANGVDLTVFAQVTVVGLERVSYVQMQGATNYETYTESKTVKFESDTQGATIYYTLTTDGSKPATPVPGAAGTKEYTGPVTLSGEAGKTVSYRFKTIAVKDGMTDSAMQYYTVVISIPAPTYTVTVQDDSGKTCALGSGTYHAGDLVTVKIADVDPDRLFTGWTATDKDETDITASLIGENTTAETFTFTMPAGNVTITAGFRNKVKYVELDNVTVTAGSALPAAGTLSATAKDKDKNMLSNAVTASLVGFTPADGTAGYGKTYTAVIRLRPNAATENIISDNVEVKVGDVLCQMYRVEGSNDFIGTLYFTTEKDTLSSIDWPGNITLYVGDTLTLPDKVSVTTVHKTVTATDLYWNGAAQVDTGAVGTYTLTALVELPDTVDTTGKELSKTITVTVKANDPVAPVTASYTESADHSGKVTLSCATEGANITYTLNGSESQTYTSGIVLPAPAEGQSVTYTIKATATKQIDTDHSMTPSTATFSYTLTTPLPTYGVTVTGGKLGETSQTAGNYAQGDTVAIVAALDSGTQRFKEWKITKADSGTDVTEELLGRNKTTDKTSFLMPDYAVKVMASVVAKISSATLSFTEPTSVNDLPSAATCAINGTNYPVALAWSTEDGAVGKLNCTATVTLRPNPAQYLVFDSPVSVTINNDAAPSFAPGNDGSLTITTKVYTLDKPTEPVPLYAVTMKNSVDSAVQAVGSYPVGSIVTITAPAKEGYQFKDWTVESGGVTLVDASKSVTTFTMPGSAVTVTANYVPRMTHVKLELYAPEGGQPLAEKVTKLEINVDGTHYQPVSQETLDKILVSWYPGGETAAFGTTYQGGIVLRPNASEKYAFSRTVTVTVNSGAEQTVSVNSDGSVNIYGTFEVPKAQILRIPSPSIDVANDTIQADALDKLPTQLTIQTEKGPMTVAVSGWSITDYNGSSAGVYNATASTIALPDDVDPTGVTVTATVIVGMAQVATPPSGAAGQQRYGRLPWQRGGLPLLRHRGGHHLLHDQHDQR